MNFPTPSIELGGVSTSPQVSLPYRPKRFRNSEDLATVCRFGNVDNPAFSKHEDLASLFLHRHAQCPCNSVQCGPR